MVRDKMKSPQPEIEFPQALEQSIFVFKLFQNSIGIGDGRVVLPLSSIRTVGRLHWDMCICITDSGSLSVINVH